METCAAVVNSSVGDMGHKEMPNPRPFSLPSYKLLREVSLAATRRSVLEGSPHVPGGGYATRFCSSS